MKSSLKILFVSSEVFPLIKTGGLADVSSGLPQAITKLGHDTRIIIPAYKQIIDEWDHELICQHPINGYDVRILSMQLPESNITVWLVDIPELFYRNGGPYSAPDGNDWPDNAERFSTFSKVVSQIACDQLDLNWLPDVVHCNDWQTGLVPAYLSQQQKRPSTIFTIHNMAYLGLFSHQVFLQLKLPENWWAWNMLEFHHHFSFIKG
ncbi:MAG: glycogen/starch synthase, partial [Gammaproteobacteria bacterium]|nr:glycogen/starch synthase [Gammaproteobacteria bacterium]